MVTGSASSSLIPRPSDIYRSNFSNISNKISNFKAPVNSELTEGKNIILSDKMENSLLQIDNIDSIAIRKKIDNIIKKCSFC